MITIYRRYIARSWTNDEFLMNLGELPHDSNLPQRKWAEFRVGCANDARWDPIAESWPKIVARPTEPGNPQQTRVLTFPQRRRRAADSDNANPTKIGSSYRFLHRTDFPEPEGRLLYLSLASQVAIHRLFLHSYSFSRTEGADGAHNIP